MKLLSMAQMVLSALIKPKQRISILELSPRQKGPYSTKHTGC